MSASPVGGDPSPPLAPGSPQWRHFTMALFLAGFASFVLIFSPQAFLAAISADLDVSPGTAAGTVSAAALGVAVGVLGWAGISDRTGRVRAMRWSLLAGVTLAAIVPVLPTIELILAVRFLEGVLVGAAPAVGMAHIAERVSGPAAVRAAGTFIAGNTFGGLVGRLLSGAAAEIGGWRLAFLTSTVAAALAAAAFLYLTRGPSTGRPAPAASIRAGAVANLRDPFMVTLYLLGFLLMGSFGVVYNFLGYHLQEQPFGLSAAVASSVFLVYLAGTLAASRSGLLAARLGTTGALFAGIAAMLCSLAAMASSSLVLTIGGLILFTVGCFTAHPLASGLTGRSARTGRSQATALYQIAWLSGISVFGWLGGIVFASGGWGATLRLVAGMCVVAVLLAGVGGLLARRRRPA
ncbi:MFS transporter [Nakamurella flava]|uniref:MFS transporter n=1 Tax=Nakamurella flava TaxID=2576308 RepID=A0A4U6QIZ5_9ACTN|nr:MFS transporter [Nakamurella flava]TKV60221.1 MFS transporter [Nakamurella flava]